MTDGGTRAARVLDVVRQLRQGSGDTEPLTAEVRHAQVDWPAQVLGRLVVLHAHDLAGRRALRAITAEDPPTGRLWRRALDDVLGWQAERLLSWLEAPRGVTIGCADQQHEVLLVDGDLVQRAHGDVDLAAERVAVALGGEVPDCVRWVLRWQDGEPIAAEAVHAAGLLSVLRWLAVTRAWTAAGLSPSAARAAVDQGLVPEDVRGHLEAGLSLRRAVDWSAHPPADARRWLSLGASPEDAADWLSQGRGLPQAAGGVAALQAYGLAKGEACSRLGEWARAAGPRVAVGELAAWAASGRSALHWGEVAARGLSHADAATWIEQGFSPSAVLSFVHVRVPVHRARQWRDAGVGARDASCLAAAGVGPEAAELLQDLTPATVAAQWAASGSVDGVRRLVASEQDRA